ncbi:formylmethanofuran dehydrogenase [Cupriavidus necator]|uniref:formylmethanofuran dehydrogenase n=1 Tax=Cupriavidus necator TaxID=106590 RepID=UPI00339D3097
MTSTRSSPAPAPGGDRSGGAPWTCPFCSLLCDDVSVVARDHAGDHTGAHLALRDGHCPRATQALGWFAAKAEPAPALIDGDPVTQAAALDAAARLLGSSRQPLFGGLATDVAGMRALYTLANRTGAILDHAHGDIMLHSMRALQDRGGFTTTLAEIRNRAGLVLCIGTQPSAKHPEFFRRCGMAEAGPVPERELVFLGTPADPAAHGLPGTRLDTVALHDDLFQTLALLNALCLPRALADDGIAPPALRELAARLKAARYAALVWNPSALAAHAHGGHAALLIERIHQLIKALNRGTRAGGLSLGGDDGANTANQVVTWLSGLPLRTGVHRGGLSHDPHRYGTQRLLRDGNADALLWVASFTPELAPPSTALPAITLGHPALAAALAGRPGVFIPVSTPGIGARGHLFRTDGGVTLPLTPVLDDGGLPTVAQVAAQLLERLPAPQPMPEPSS